LFPLEQKLGWTRAVKASRAMAFEASRLRDLFRADHYLEYAIIRKASQDMADRISVARQRLVEVLESHHEAGAHP